MQTFGIGIESEGFIVDSNGRGVPRIGSEPSSEWITREIRKVVPQLADKTSLEQASVMLEVKSDVFPDGMEAIRQVQEVRAQVDRLLAPHGCRLVFRPVLSEPFEFVPATSDPESRTHRLIEEWSKTDEGPQMLLATATSSFQINDSRPFATMESLADKMEMARRAHNVFSGNFDRLNVFNDPQIKNHLGKTRLEMAMFLLTKVKAEQFGRHGFRHLTESVVPPFFADVEAMKRWMCAHSDVADFGLAHCKNEHAVTAKVKRDPWWGIETRILDAVDSESEMAQLIRANDGFLGLIQGESAFKDAPPRMEAMANPIFDSVRESR